MVGRQISKNDHSVNITGSSIALLQERFRRLEKMKEKREEEEEKQLIFSSPSPDHHHHHYLAKRNAIMISSDAGSTISSPVMIRDELILPARRTPCFHHHQDPLSLGLSTKHADYRSALPHQPCFNSLWSSDKRGVKRPQMFDISDVDTSLHL